MKPTRRGFFGILGGIGAAATGALKLELPKPKLKSKEVPIEPSPFTRPDRHVGGNGNLWINGEPYEYNELQIDMMRDMGWCTTIGEKRYVSPVNMRPHGRIRIVLPGTYLSGEFCSDTEVHVVIPTIPGVPPGIPAITEFDGVISSLVGAVSLDGLVTTTVTVEIIHPPIFSDPT